MTDRQSFGNERALSLYEGQLEQSWRFDSWDDDLPTTAQVRDAIAEAFGSRPEDLHLRRSVKGGAPYLEYSPRD